MSGRSQLIVNRVQLFRDAIAQVHFHVENSSTATSRFRPPGMDIQKPGRILLGKLRMKLSHFLEWVQYLKQLKLSSGQKQSNGKEEKHNIFNWNYFVLYASLYEYKT